jgi:RNase H-fold protein (predicted Holliday junction resolvase)
MHSNSSSDQPTLLGFDPGRLKCGIAVMGVDRILRYHQVISAENAIAEIETLRQTYPVSLLVMGNQTSSKEWKMKLSDQLVDPLRIIMVDERNSTLEARDRYWKMYPPQGLLSLIPQPLRNIARPIDDIVAVLLIERYLEQLVE